MSIGVFCFRNDLRLHDNSALQFALSECDQLHLVYSFEERLWTAQNPKRIAAHRANFILDSLTSLKKEIQDRGGILHFIHGNLEESIPRFMNQLGADTCFMSEENAWEERTIEQTLSQIVPFQSKYSKTLIHLDDLPFDLPSLPKTFSKFRILVEKNLSIRSCCDAPKFLSNPRSRSSTCPSLEELGFNNFKPCRNSYFKFNGGSPSGQDRIMDWVWEKNCIAKYKQTRNQLKGADFSSRFSPWLAIGCLSPREIYWAVRNYESKHGANESTYWLIFELLWRDFFHFTARLHGAKIFQTSGFHTERPTSPNSEVTSELFSSWKKGTTSNPFVNANMNELRKTGWISNRGRQNVASFLINDLGVDWIKGAQWFEEQLIDFDPCSNYGNWLYLSGYGNDPRKNRVFN